MICNESCQKSQQLQFAEIRKMVFVDPAWNILTCASQNMDEEMSKSLAVKIIQTYTQLHSFFYIRMLFLRPRLNILIFLPILGWKYSCIILKL